MITMKKKYKPWSYSDSVICFRYIEGGTGEYELLKPAHRGQYLFRCLSLTSTKTRWMIRAWIRCKGSRNTGATQKAP